MLHQLRPAQHGRQRRLHVVRDRCEDQVTCSYRLFRHPPGRTQALDQRHQQQGTSDKDGFGQQIAG